MFTTSSGNRAKFINTKNLSEVFLRNVWKNATSYFYQFILCPPLLVLRQSYAQISHRLSSPPSCPLSPGIVCCCFRFWWLVNEEHLHGQLGLQKEVQGLVGEHLPVLHHLWQVDCQLFGLGGSSVLLTFHSYGTCDEGRATHRSGFMGKDGRAA